MQAEINVTLIISIVAVAFTVYNTLVNRRREHRADTQSDTTTITTVLVKLESMGNGIARIEKEQSNSQSAMQDQRDRLIAMEQSLKSAWARLEAIEKRLGTGGP